LRGGIEVFTGIVEEIGTVREARMGTLVIGAETVMGDLKLGDSIAVDGTCLTVVQRTERSFTVTVQPETLRRTIIGGYAPGRRVNLERALLATGRLGGHIVQGHVDGTGRVAELRPDGDGLVARFQAPTNLMCYIVTKGFVALNGTSLTVVDVGPDWFTVALIRYTRDHVALLDGGVGAAVNLEVDILAKYVERLLDARTGSAEDAGLTLDKLREAGFAPGSREAAHAIGDG
jgi:riboflavin synthase